MASELRWVSSGRQRRSQIVNSIVLGSPPTKSSHRLDDHDNDEDDDEDENNDDEDDEYDDDEVFFSLYDNILTILQWSCQFFLHSGLSMKHLIVLK